VFWSTPRPERGYVDRRGRRGDAGRLGGLGVPDHGRAGKRYLTLDFRSRLGANPQVQVQRSIGDRGRFAAWRKEGHVRGFRAGLFPSGKLFPRIRAVSVAARESIGKPVGKPDPGVASRDQRAETRGVPRETAPFPRVTAPARMLFRATAFAACGRTAPPRTTSVTGKRRRGEPRTAPRRGELS
jgi:hypothetical protein